MVRVSSGERKSVQQAEGRKPLYQGMDDALVRAIQLVVTPLLLALIGHVVDAKTGTGIVFALAFGLLGLTGECYRAYLWYTAKMQRAEEGKPWTR